MLDKIGVSDYFISIKSSRKRLQVKRKRGNGYGIYINRIRKRQRL